jgi:hypothetical protein
MEFDSSLTMIGVIATILSVAFALAAFFNSRRKQTRVTAKTKPVNPEEVVEQCITADHPSAAKEDDTIDMRTKSVFKQVGPQGSEMTSSVHYNDDEYVWE